MCACVCMCEWELVMSVLCWRQMSFRLRWKTLLLGKNLRSNTMVGRLPPLNFSQKAPTHTPTHRFGGRIVSLCFHGDAARIQTQAHRLRMCTQSQMCIWYARVFRQHEHSIIPGSRSSSHLPNTEKKEETKSESSKFSAEKETSKTAWAAMKRTTTTKAKYKIHTAIRYIHQNSWVWELKRESGSKRFAEVPLFVLARYIFYVFSVLNLSVFSSFRLSVAPTRILFLSLSAFYSWLWPVIQTDNDGHDDNDTYAKKK